MLTFRDSEHGNSAWLNDRPLTCTVAVMWKLYRPVLNKTVGKCLLLFMWYSAEPKISTINLLCETMFGKSLNNRRLPRIKANMSV